MTNCDHLWVAGGLSSDWVCEHCGERRDIDYNDYSSGSTHPDCPGDTDHCPDNGCKNCQGLEFDNRMRGRIKR